MTNRDRVRDVQFLNATAATNEYWLSRKNAFKVSLGLLLLAVRKPYIKITLTDKPALRVELHSKIYKPTECKVWRDGVLIFAGRDHSADVERQDLMPKQDWE
jgi:hypothetical protein